MRRRGVVSTCVALGVSAALAGCAGASGGEIDAASGVLDGAGGDPDAAPDAPPGVEICDGQDNDGDQFVDEGTPEELCGVVEHGTPKCNGLAGCAVDACSPGFADVDGLYSSGCECAEEPGELGSTVCDEGANLGDLPDSNTEMIVTGNLVPVGDVDFYRFHAVDVADDACDKFHVRVMFLENPDDEFLVEVTRGGCAGTVICPGATDAQWYTNFTDGATPPTGQCPCVPESAPSATVNTCSDDSADFVVKVVRAPGKPVSCHGYKLEISNGKYAAP
jgi:hypothetical protein